MATRFSAGQYFQWSTAPSLSDFTIAAWVRFTSLPVNNGYAGIFTRGSATPGIGVYLYTAGGVTKFALGDDVNNYTSTIVPVTNVWYHVAWGRSGNANDIFYVNGVQQIGPNNLDETNVTSTLSVLFDPYTSNGSGEYAGVKVWNGVQLTQREILLEKRQLRPVCTANLWAFVPLLTPVFRDVSGLGNHPTLTGSPVSCSNPPVTTKMVWQVPFVVGATNYALTANDISNSVPSVATTAITQDHVCAAAAITNNTPVLGTPSLGTGNTLLANDITTSSPTLVNATVQQLHILTATAPSIGPPSVDAATLTQNNVLTGANIAVGAPVLGAPSLTVSTLGPEQTLLGSLTPSTADSGDTSAVELGLRFRVAVDGVVTGVRFYKGGTYNGGTHSGTLWTSTGTSLATKNFSGETSSGWQTVYFDTPVSISAGTEYVASYFAPSGRYSITSNYFASERTNGDITGYSGTNNVYTYSATSTFPTSSYLSTAYFVDVIFRANASFPNAVDIVTGQPSVGTPSVAQNHSVSTGAITTGSPIVEAGVLTCNHALAGASITNGAPTLGTPAITQVHSVSATGIATTAPNVGTPTLLQNHVLNLQNVSTGSPTIQNPVHTQDHVLTATAIVNGSPVVGATSITQDHVISAASIATGAPSVGSPDLVFGAGFGAVSIVTGAPSLEAPTLTQVHDLTASSITNNAPTIDTVALTYNVLLAASDITTAAPNVNTTALTQVHNLTGSDIGTAQPILGKPALGVGGVFIADDLVTNAPELGTPAVYQNHMVVAQVVVGGAPVVGATSITQMHVVAPTSITTGQPTCAPAVMVYNAVLTPLDVTVGTPALGSPTLISDVALTALGFATGAPELSQTDISQRHALFASTIVTDVPMLGAPGLGTGQRFVGLYTYRVLSARPIVHNGRQYRIYEVKRRF